MASSPIRAVRCHVSGRVQGVFYRASTKQKAIELGCRGYARNLPDGRVEVLAVGEPEAVRSLVDWLWQGPPSAHVTDVACAELEVQGIGAVPDGFAAR